MSLNGRSSGDCHNRLFELLPRARTESCGIKEHNRVKYWAQISIVLTNIEPRVVLLAFRKVIQLKD